LFSTITAGLLGGAGIKPSFDFAGRDPVLGFAGRVTILVASLILNSGF
jgi:hypothetical protein